MVGHARGAPPGRCPTPWGPQSSAGLLPAPASSGGDGCLPAGVGSALLSQEAQTLISNDIRLSTKRVYESRVKIFRFYCQDIGCLAETAPPEIIANFLAILASTLQFSYQTVCGYRSAVSKLQAGYVGKLIPV